LNTRRSSLGTQRLGPHSVHKPRGYRVSRSDATPLNPSTRHVSPHPATALGTRGGSSPLIRMAKSRGFSRTQSSNPTLTSENPPTPDRESPKEVVAGKLKRHAEEIVRMSDEFLVMTSGAFDVRKSDLTRRASSFRIVSSGMRSSNSRVRRRKPQDDWNTSRSLIVLTAAVVLHALTLVVLEFVLQRHIGHIPTAQRRRGPTGRAGNPRCRAAGAMRSPQSLAQLRPEVG
jgi:hypothetical protein